MIGPLEFFSHLRWIDDRPLLEVIEPYRQRIFTEALYTFDEGTPHYNLALTGRGKKNWKSADLILAALYRFLARESPQGNDCFPLANDEGQAGDDLKLLPPSGSRPRHTIRYRVYRIGPDLTTPDHTLKTPLQRSATPALCRTYGRDPRAWGTPMVTPVMGSRSPQVISVLVYVSPTIPSLRCEWTTP